MGVVEGLELLYDFLWFWFGRVGAQVACGHVAVATDETQLSTCFFTSYVEVAS